MTLHPSVLRLAIAQALSGANTTVVYATAAIIGHLLAPRHHAAAPVAFPSEGAWAERIVGIGSEWSPHYPGYLAGALDATQRGLQALGVPASAAL